MALFNNAKNIALVVNFPTKEKEDAYGPLVSSLERLGRYASIIHDKDVLEDGTLKTAHAHIVLQGEEARSSKSWLDLVSMALDLDRKCISIEACKNVTGALRYLVHKDDTDKAQYDPSAIITNCSDDVKTALEATAKRPLDSFTADELLACPTLRDLLDLCGNALYLRLKPIYLDLRAENLQVRQVSKDYEDMALRHRDAVAEISDIIDKETLPVRVRTRLADVQRILTLGSDRMLELNEGTNKKGND